jgi:hypothetical protein
MKSFDWIDTLVYYHYRKHYGDGKYSGNAFRIRED